ncbi:MAG: succinate dehydrogenase cytochrome b subunit [Candidatus Delongbacteria bacterium]|nr:succinate dehydrogenase cytochrome b subunit [Candidatus Delongbacteria bacterium]
MAWFTTFRSSSIGRKLLMALTGLALLLFLLGHMAGNLQFFAGADTLNAYAAALRHNIYLLWGIRGTLLLIFLVHVISAIQLTLANRAARPEPYAVQKPLQSTFASRTMFLSGLVVLGYIVFHLAHLTVGVVGPEHRLQVGSHVPDAYANVVAGFSNPLIAGLYILSMVVLFFHLSHGAQSALQTLGFNHPKYTPMVRGLLLGLVFLICAGFISIPLAVLLAWY